LLSYTVVEEKDEGVEDPPPKQCKVVLKNGQKPVKEGKRLGGGIDAGQEKR